MKRRDFLKGMSAAVGAIVATGFENVIFAKEDPSVVAPVVTPVETAGKRSCSDCRECVFRPSVIAKEKMYMYCGMSYFCQPVDGDEAETCSMYHPRDRDSS